MYRYYIAVAVLASALLPALAQSPAHKQPRPEQMGDRAIDADRNDIKALIEAGRKREEASNSKTLDLWSRWIYAVCIGCGYTPKNVRIVYTTPARVLAGIPAAEDDARERSARRRTRTARATRRRVTQAVY